MRAWRVLQWYAVADGYVRHSERCASTKQVAFWSAARDPGKDESSLSARLSALSGPRSGLAAGAARQEYLTKCVGLVVGARKAASGGNGDYGGGSGGSGDVSRRATGELHDRASTLRRPVFWELSLGLGLSMSYRCCAKSGHRWCLKTGAGSRWDRNARRLSGGHVLRTEFTCLEPRSE